MGVTAEGMLTDPIVYNLFYDAWWSDGPINATEWLPGYLRSRYGAAHPDVLQAWTGLFESVYSSGARLTGEGLATTKPPPTRPTYPYDEKTSTAATRSAEAFRLMASLASDSSSSIRPAATNVPFLYDLVDTGREALDLFLTDAVNLLLGESGHGRGDETKALGAFVEGVLDDMELLLRGSPCRDHYVANWI